MCGIAGYITTKTTTHQHAVAVAILAKHMDERGGHSWGYMTGTGDTHKALGSVNTGLAVGLNMPVSFALHTRYGTTGANVVDNAHPFTAHGASGAVVGVHNGIISNHSALNQTLKRACVVDSQHIFQSIAEGRTLNDLQGYGAIAYTLNGQWYLGRFNDGELSAVKTSEGIFFASTKDALFEAMSYAGITIIKWLKIRNNNVYRLTLKGLERAYSIDAASTSRRWNDDLLDDLRWPDAPAKSSRRSALECDYCGSDSDGALYQYERDFCCGGCYLELTGEKPNGYSFDDRLEASSYNYHY